jgi:SAM-dependent methyltransferase
MLKLNLGAGTSRYQDYISVDYHHEADLQHDLTTPLPYQNGEVDAIYSSHVVEHFTREEWGRVAGDWDRVLKPGAKIEIRCPDIEKLCQLVVNGTDLELQLTRIYGQQGDEGQLHKNGFTETTLAQSFPNFASKLLEPSTDYELHMELTKP